MLTACRSQVQEWPKSPASTAYHDPVDEVIYHGGDAINSTQSIVKRALFRWRHREFSPLAQLRGSHDRCLLPRGTASESPPPRNYLAHRFDVVSNSYHALDQDGGVNPGLAIVRLGDVAQNRGIARGGVGIDCDHGATRVTFED